MYSSRTAQWQLESNLAAMANGTFNPINSNLNSKVNFSSDKRAFNSNAFNNQLLNSFVQHYQQLQQNNNNNSNTGTSSSSSTAKYTGNQYQQQHHQQPVNQQNLSRATFIQGFPMQPQNNATNPSNIFPASFVQFNQAMSQQTANFLNFNLNQPQSIHLIQQNGMNGSFVGLVPMPLIPNGMIPHSQQQEPTFISNSTDPQISSSTSSSSLLYYPKFENMSLNGQMMEVPNENNYRSHNTKAQTTKTQLNNQNTNINNKKPLLNRKPTGSVDPDFYFDSGSSTGPISSSSSTNNDSLSSNVSSSESDCDTKNSNESETNSLNNHPQNRHHNHNHHININNNSHHSLHHNQYQNYHSISRMKKLNKNSNDNSNKLNYRKNSENALNNLQISTNSTFSNYNPFNTNPSTSTANPNNTLEQNQYFNQNPPPYYKKLNSNANLNSNPANNINKKNSFYNNPSLLNDNNLNKINQNNQNYHYYNQFNQHNNANINRNKSSNTNSSTITPSNAIKSESTTTKNNLENQFDPLEIDNSSSNEYSLDTNDKKNDTLINVEDNLSNNNTTTISTNYSSVVGQTLSSLPKAASSNLIGKRIFYLKNIDSDKASYFI